MVFNILSDGILQLDQTATQDPFRGGEHRVYDGGDRIFAKRFASNIRAQGFSEAARAQLDQITITHEEDPEIEIEEPASESSEPDEIQPALLDEPASIGDYSMDAEGTDPSWSNLEPAEPTPQHKNAPPNLEPREIPPLKPLSANAQRNMAQEDREALITQARAMD